MCVECLEAFPLLNNGKMIVTDWLLHRDGGLDVYCRLVLDAAFLGENLWLDFMEFCEIGVSFTFFALNSGKDVNDVLGLAHFRSIIYIVIDLSRR